MLFCITKNYILEYLIEYSYSLVACYAQNYLFAENKEKDDVFLEEQSIL